MITRGFNKQGGISRYVVELSERFVKENEIYLLTINYNYVISDLIVHKKLAIKKPYLLHILFDIYYNAKYSERMKKEGIDIIHSQGTYSKKCDIVTMHSCHKAWINYYKSWSFTRKLRGVADPVTFVALSVERKVLEKASKKIIAVSEGVKREILENYNVPAEKIDVIPNGVDLEEFKPDVEKRKRIRMKYRIDGNEIVLMFSGYEFKRKGLRYIIEALPKVKENVKLLVVGRDNLRGYQELASKLGVLDKIIFAGFVPEIADYYAASDIFVFPTAYEAFSLATLEAAASSLPILATKVNGTEELIDEGYNGFFIKREPEDIAEKINILIEDDELRRRMSKNVRKTAEKYPWDEVAKRTLKVYEEVVKR